MTNAINDNKTDLTKSINGVEIRMNNAISDSKTDLTNVIHDLNSRMINSFADMEIKMINSIKDNNIKTFDRMDSHYKWIMGISIALISMALAIMKLF